MRPARSGTTARSQRQLASQKLDAETSITGSVGFVYQPVSAFILTTDFYHININDRIIVSGFLEPSRDGPDGSRIPNEDLPASVRAALENSSISAAQFFMNAADTRTQGVDVVATWNVPLALRGDLGLKFLATVSETEITDVNLPLGLPDELYTDRDQSILEEWQPQLSFYAFWFVRLGQVLSSASAARLRPIHRR